MKLSQHGNATSVTRQRIDMVANQLVSLMPHEGSILHIGCGNGMLAERLNAILPAARFRGVDSADQKNAIMPVHKFDGVQLPFGDRSFDAVMMVDMFRGQREDFALLKEAKRVVRQHIILKDRNCPGAARSTRSLFNWSRQTDMTRRIDQPLSKPNLMLEFEKLGLSVEFWDERSTRNLGRPGTWVFGGVSTYVARLRV